MKRENKIESTINDLDITEFASPAMSEYLVGQGLVGVNNTKLNKSATIIRSSLIVK